MKHILLRILFFKTLILVWENYREERILLSQIFLSGFMFDLVLNMPLLKIIL